MPRESPRSSRGVACIFTFMEAATRLIDDFGPLPVLRPGSVAELGDVVRQAVAAETALYPVGGGTSLNLGRRPTRPGSALDTRGLDQVIEFAARDMTVTVQAGITVARLQEILAAEKLRLPIDVPQASEATLGGILAANVSGPRRLGYGTLRDYVIGIAAVNDAGNEFKAGGRVVKNVAGYDLCKLLVGSLGTLGVITQATLKLRPLAEEQALIGVSIEAEHVARLLTRLHESRTRPVCADLLSRSAAEVVFAQAGLPAPRAAWEVLVGYEGNAEAVKWQVQQLVKELCPGCPIEARIGFTARALWQALVEWAHWSEANFTLRASLLPHAVADFCRAADAEPDRPLLRAHAGSGIVTGHWRAGLAPERAAALRAAWHARAAAGQGAVVVPRCPPAWKDTIAVWDVPRDRALMHAVKARFDPRDLFNPGRFLDGIEPRKPAAHLPSMS